MNVVKATRNFEAWLAQRTHLDKKDLRLKHARMKAELFPFFRATYYRWAQLWPQICPELAKASHVLAVGDLHVENFGTWRDIEGRLIWGVNDFDEAWPMAYTIDLVRLAVSAHLAVDVGRLPLKREDICGTLLEGYRESLQEQGRAFVLSEKHPWLRFIAEGETTRSRSLLEKNGGAPHPQTEVPISAVDAIEHLMPAPGISYRLVHRVAGLGSLGHARYVAIAIGTADASPAKPKALAPSSNCWAEASRPKGQRPPEILYQTIINPCRPLSRSFCPVARTLDCSSLAPDCSRIELASLGSPNTELRLLHSMGWETANIHLGTPSARKAILRHLDTQKARWLHRAARSHAWSRPLRLGRLEEKRL